MDDEELSRIAERLAIRRSELKDNVDAATERESSTAELLDRVKRLQVRLDSTVGGPAPTPATEAPAAPPAADEREDEPST
jgi:hypothetical protein